MMHYSAQVLLQCVFLAANTGATRLENSLPAAARHQELRQKH
jgi:hypothetical protein